MGLHSQSGERESGPETICQEAQAGGLRIHAARFPPGPQDARTAACTACTWAARPAPSLHASGCRRLLLPRTVQPPPPACACRGLSGTRVTPSGRWRWSSVAAPSSCSPTRVRPRCGADTPWVPSGPGFYPRTSAEAWSQTGGTRAAPTEAAGRACLPGCSTPLSWCSRDPACSPALSEGVVPAVHMPGLPLPAVPACQPAVCNPRRPLPASQWNAACRSARPTLRRRPGRPRRLGASPSARCR